MNCTNLADPVWVACGLDGLQSFQPTSSARLPAHLLITQDTSITDKWDCTELELRANQTVQIVRQIAKFESHWVEMTSPIILFTEFENSNFLFSTTRLRTISITLQNLWTFLCSCSLSSDWEGDLSSFYQVMSRDFNQDGVSSLEQQVRPTIDDLCHGWGLALHSPIQGHLDILLREGLSCHPRTPWTLINPPPTHMSEIVYWRYWAAYTKPGCLGRQQKWVPRVIIVHSFSMELSWHHLQPALYLCYTF